MCPSASQKGGGPALPIVHFWARNMASSVCRRAAAVDPAVLTCRSAGSVFRVAGSGWKWHAAGSVGVDVASACCPYARFSPHPSALFRPCMRPSERVPARSVPSKPPPAPLKAVSRKQGRNSADRCGENRALLADRSAVSAEPPLPLLFGSRSDRRSEIGI